MRWGVRVAIRTVLCGLLIAAHQSHAQSAPRESAGQILVMLHLPATHYRPEGAYGGGYDDRLGRAARQRVAAALAHDYGLTVLDDWPMASLGVECYLMAPRGDSTPTELIEKLSRDPRTEWAQEVHWYSGLTHADPGHLLQPSANYWHLDELHRVTTGQGIRVALVDSAVEANHPALAGQVALERNFVDASRPAGEAHGTAVAGIIAARPGNSLGIVAVAPEARLLALRACWEADAGKTLCNSFTLAKALQFAIDADAQVINMSLTGPPDRLLGTLLDAALARGIVVVSAVDTAQGDGGFPASHQGVVNVTTPDVGRLTHGMLVAPGRDVPTTAPGGRFSLASGTSFAAAEVSGLAALLLQLNPGASARAPIAWETFTAAAPDHPAGVIDACATVARVARGCTCTCAATSSNRATQ